MNKVKPRVIVLDVEGTIISNAVSMFPRPGLFDFLNFLKEQFSRIIIMTALEERIFRKVAKILCDEGSAPDWFLFVEYWTWKEHYEGVYKDLRCVSNVDTSDVMIIDDMQQYINPDQLKQWIPIDPFVAPYSDDDLELERIKAIILKTTKLHP